MTSFTKKGLCVLFGLIILSPFFLYDAQAQSKKSYTITARAAIFSNSSKIVRYYGKNVHMKVPPASTTKVMTALVVLDHLSLDKVVTVSKRATGAAPSKINLRQGEQYHVRDLLYALLLNSANDASIVLAEAVAGSESQFVQLMNEKARELGANHTKFVNSHGLPTKAKQFTTAYDMYLIFRAALKYPFFKDAIKHTYKTIASRSGRSIRLKSHNKMLFMNWKRKPYGKTGYTHAARACFVGYVMKGNDVCIIAVFGCRQRWTDIKFIISQYGGIAL